MCELHVATILWKQGVLVVLYNPQGSADGDALVHHRRGITHLPELLLDKAVESTKEGCRTSLGWGHVI